jgi:tetratricopeptide (TPR) repeat protein
MYKYYKNAKKISVPKTFFKLYEYNKILKNKEKMIKYLILGSDNNDHQCSELLGDFYQKYKQYNLMEYFYNLSFLQYNNDKVINKLVSYYESINDIDNRIKYLKLIPNNINALNKLISYYENINDIDNVIKYLIIASDINDINAANKLISYYESINDIDNMIKYLIIASNNKNIYATHKLISYYESINDIDNMIKYLIVSSNYNNMDAINRLIKYYESINDIDNMIKYLLIKLKNCNDDSIISTLDDYLAIDIIHKLGSYYKSISEIKKMKKYYLMGIKLNDIKSINKMISYYTNKNIKLNPIFKTQLLEQNTINNNIKDFIIHLFDKKQEMKWVYSMCKKYNINNPKINHQIQIIDNKMNFSKIDICPICFDTEKLIPYECFSHYYCLDCLYQGVYKHKKCAICRLSCTETTISNKHIISIIDDDDDN